MLAAVSAIYVFLKDFVVLILDKWWDRRQQQPNSRATLKAERQMAREADSPLSALYVASDEALRLLTRQGRRPALFIAPLIGADTLGKGWPDLVSRAYRALPGGDDAGDSIGLFNKPLDRGEVHVNLIWARLSKFPVVLVHGSIDDNILHLRIDGWNITEPRRRRWRPSMSGSRRFSSCEAEIPLLGAKDLDGVAADVAILCAKIVECFHISRGRPPFRYLQRGHGHISDVVALEWASVALASLEHSYQNDDFRPLDHLREGDLEHSCFTRLQSQHKDSKRAVRNLAFHLYTAALLSFLGKGSELDDHVEYILKTAASNAERASSMLSALDARLNESAKASYRNSQLRDEIIGRVHQRYAAARDEKIRRRIDG